MTYRVSDDAAGVLAGEGLVLVCTDDEVGQGVEAEGGVVGPVDGRDVERQGAQVALTHHRLRKLQPTRSPHMLSPTPLG